MLLQHSYDERNSMRVSIFPIGMPDSVTNILVFKDCRHNIIKYCDMHSPMAGHPQDSENSSAVL